MELHHIRGGNKEELEAKAYNIGVGISLGNKWFTPETIVELVHWSLQYTREYVIVYVADSIHAINEEVRGRTSPQRAMARSLRKGSEILEGARVLVEKHFSEDDKKRIVYVTWNEILDTEYERKLAWLVQYFYETPAFAECIKRIVSSQISKEQKVFTEDDVEKLSMYILSEMPEVLSRVPMRGYECDAYVYPFDGALTQLAEQIQKGEAFPQINEKIIDTQPKVFLEVR
jgi:tRNA-dependent cyclodipeptide synthase